MIAKLLTVESKARPSTKEILKMASIVKKSKELESKSKVFEAIDNYDDEEDPLLKTIRVPGNLANLTSRLPKSNYSKIRGSLVGRPNSRFNDSNADRETVENRRNLTQI
jgi:hypothetical protein